MSEALPFTQRELNNRFHNGERAKQLFPENYNEYGQKTRLREKWGFGSHQSFFYNLGQKDWNTSLIVRICNAEGISLAEWFAPTRIGKLEVVNSGGNIRGDGNIVNTQTGIGNTAAQGCDHLRQEIEMLKGIITQKDSLIAAYREMINSR